MKFFIKVLFLYCFCECAFYSSAKCQDSIGAYNKILQGPEKLVERVDGKVNKATKKIEDKSTKYLKKLAGIESKIKKQIAKQDSSAAHQLFDKAEKEYADLQAKVSNVSGRLNKLTTKYVPHLDSLTTAFAFLSKAGDAGKTLSKSKDKITNSLGKLNILQDKFNQAEQVKNFVQQRQQLLQQVMLKYNLSRYLKAYQKQVTYYKAQIEEYKNIFNDPSRIESKALELLGKSEAFKNFFAKNSELSRLFRLPTNSTENLTVNLAGLQTRQAVEQELLKRFGQVPNAGKAMQQAGSVGMAQWHQIKDKLIGKLNSEKSGDMPDFKPNNQKTKSFLKRLELGTNFQSVKSSRFFPSTTDIGLSLGYKMNAKSIVGIGGAYKMGWGKDFKHIVITHQGIGLRSFLDYKVKGNIWLTGGMDINYRSQFRSFEVLRDYSAWQKSALVGISKKYKVSNNIKGNAQLLFDGLWKQQVPRSQPFIFRFGYSR